VERLREKFFRRSRNLVGRKRFLTRTPLSRILFVRSIICLAFFFANLIGLTVNLIDMTKDISFSVGLERF